MKVKIGAFIKEHKYVVIGVVLGAVTFVLLLTIRFWATLLLALLVAVGWFIGSAADKGMSPVDKLAQIIEKFKALFQKK